jgi:polynucleotide 5'-hydroxyl-kinase GRC3/NOL9
LFQGEKQLQQIVESNRTLLVDGPASARLISGKAEVFGCPMRESQRIVVREGKRLPFFAVEKAVFDVSLGPNASVTETIGSTIPSSWNKLVDAILGLQKRPTVVMILGTADSGKSSLCTYILNKIVIGKCKTAVLDGDLVQSDIGPSATVGYALATKPATDLYDLKLKNAFFVGVTSPIMEAPKAIEGLVAMKAEILQQQVDFVLVNTDGWVSGDDAINYKTTLTGALKPDFIVGVQVQDELVPLIASLDTQVAVVESSSALNPRTTEKRKSLREMTYARYLKNSKLQCYPKSQVIIEPRSAIPKKQEPEKGIIVGLCGRGSKFLGIGVLREINQLRKALKVQTAVSAKPLRIVIGKVIVNEKLQEVQE